MTYVVGDRVRLRKSLTIITMGYDDDGCLVPVASNLDLPIGLRGVVSTMPIGVCEENPELVPVTYTLHRWMVWTPRDFLEVSP
jgi:hypothetical protein